jgi:hypothetical protein
LAQAAALDREAADLGFAVDDFLVGQDGAQFRAPPDGPLVDVREAAAEELQEDPLGPADVARVGGVDLALPVIAKPSALICRRKFVMLFCVLLAGCVPVLTACCSAGSPNASQPMGCRTEKPFARL